ncbi:MAG: hypothetical protein RLZZ12_226 [Actinomycetota bacterium]|jgi:hypothetical protein
MREVINWPVRVWLLFALLNLSVLVAVGVALSNTALLILGLTLATASIAFSKSSRLVLILSDGLLSVGRAQIEIKYVKDVLVLDESAMAYERGAGLNPRAFLALRFWVKTGVKIALNDPLDPTPYWLVSTRRAQELKEKIGK